MARAFVTGGTGVIGTALVTALLARGDDVVGLARSERSAQALRGRGVQAVRGETWDVEAMTAGMRGCDVAFHLAGINSLCVADPGPMRRANVDGAVAAVRAAAAAGVARVVHTSSAATIGEPAGAIGTESTTPRGWFLSTYEQTKTEGEHAALRVARECGQDVVCVNPSSVQGPGRAGGTGRFLLLFLDGRLKVFVDTNLSLVDIDDCVAGHLLAAARGVAGERYLLSGIRLTITEALALAAEVAGVDVKPRLAPRAVATIGGACVEGAFRLAGKRPPVCREMIRTLLHGHRYDGSKAERELGLTYTPAPETLRKTIEWARAEGLLRNA
ncbi:MAG TPA: NAD-dependent epimerase/dehydratase family protein [Solirubrobacteraceae bacterium]|jgi:dihydroflavonol-4-reductase|nr:NAD-dependent epimerase/dehydratase family protein [Solirubrobacteraceae bacterium]